MILNVEHYQTIFVFSISSKKSTNSPEDVLKLSQAKNSFLLHLHFTLYLSQFYITRFWLLSFSIRLHSRWTVK